jgi:TP901-1 family phage major tail protein
MGRHLWLKIGDGGEPETFVVVAGVLARTITLSAGLVEATTPASPGAWRELVAGAGTKRIEVAGTGLFASAASDARMRDAFLSGETPRLRLQIAEFGVISGPFAIAELVYTGEHSTSAFFSIRLSSAGAISFEA